MSPIIYIAVKRRPWLDYGANSLEHDYFYWGILIRGVRGLSAKTKSTRSRGNPSEPSEVLGYFWELFA